MLTSIWRGIPEPVRRSVRRAAAHRIFADNLSEETLWSAFHTPPGHPSGHVAVALRALDGRPVYIRPGTSDSIVLVEAFVGRFHLPPRSSGRDRLRLIWDLGANIGLTAAHLAVRFPEAQIIAVEPNPESAELARRNVEPWGDRCEIVNAAIWHQDGEVILDTSEREYSAKVAVGGNGALVAAISPKTLLGMTGERVDYAKIDIEGAEEGILRRAGEWAARVSCLKVELHAPYSTSAARADLTRQGFRVRRSLPRSQTLIATR